MKNAELKPLVGASGTAAPSSQFAILTYMSVHHLFVVDPLEKVFVIADPASIEALRPPPTVWLVALVAMATPLTVQPFDPPMVVPSV